MVEAAAVCSLTLRLRNTHSLCNALANGGRGEPRKGGEPPGIPSSVAARLAALRKTQNTFRLMYFLGFFWMSSARRFMLCVAWFMLFTASLSRR